MHTPTSATPAEQRAAAMRAHPSSWRRHAAVEDAAGIDVDDGSLVAEYGLVAVLGATVAALAIKWASSGKIFELFSAVLERVQVLVGA